MLVNLLLGIVALGAMQATKPLNANTNEKYVNVSFILNIQNFLTPAEEGLLTSLDVYYNDEQSDNIKTFNLDISEDLQETFRFGLTGISYIELSEIIFTGFTYEYSYTARQQPELQEGYYNIWNTHQGYYFDIERTNDELTQIRTDTEMYTLLNNIGTTTLTGWYAIDPKYTFQYSSLETVTLESARPNEKNAVFYFLTNELSNGYLGYPLWENRVINLKGNQIDLQYPNSTINWIQTLNYYYLGNIKNNPTLWNLYNVYKINYPERLNNNIVNKTYYVNQFNPYGGTGYEFRSGSIKIKATLVGGAPSDHDVEKDILEGLCIIDNQYAYRITNWYHDPVVNYEISPSGEIQDIGRGNEDILYTCWEDTTYPTLDDTALNILAKPAFRSYNDNGTIKDAYTGETVIYKRNIYVAFNEIKTTPTLEECLLDNYNWQGASTTDNIFTLVANGFRSLQVILDFKVGWLPVGQLMFAPLVVGFVIWLIHLVKRG